MRDPELTGPENPGQDRGQPGGVASESHGVRQLTLVSTHARCSPSDLGKEQVSPKQSRHFDGRHKVTTHDGPKRRSSREKQESSTQEDLQPSQQRKLTGVYARVAWTCAVSLPVLTLWCAFSGWWDAMTRSAGHLMIAVPLVYLYYPARKRSFDRVTAVDVFLAALSFVAFGWIVVSQNRLMWRLVYVDPLTWPDFILGIVAVVVVLEATRRIIGWALVITALVFLFYALAGPIMPGVLQHQGVRLSLLIDHLYMVPEGLFNILMGIMATYLFTFLTFASLLQVAGGTRIVMDLAVALGGRFVGGPAKVAVVSSALMGMVSGSTSANAVTTGSITIPLMKRHGFRPVEAGGGRDRLRRRRCTDASHHGCGRVHHVGAHRVFLFLLSSCTRSFPPYSILGVSLPMSTSKPPSGAWQAPIPRQRSR